MKKNKRILLALIVFFFGCEAAMKSQDCGNGDMVSVDGQVYCVYLKNVVIENGFKCPPDLPRLSEEGNLGVCGQRSLDGQEFADVQEQFDETYPDKAEPVEKSKAIACETDDDCVNSSCSNGFCE